MTTIFSLTGFEFVKLAAMQLFYIWPALLLCVSMIPRYKF